MTSINSGWHRILPPLLYIECAVSGKSANEYMQFKTWIYEYCTFFFSHTKDCIDINRSAFRKKETRIKLYG
jgi:hypothetical protein